MSPTAKVTYISLSADDPALDAAFDSAIADVRDALGRSYPLHVAGATRAGAAPIESRSPTDARVVVARVATATEAAAVHGGPSLGTRHVRGPCDTGGSASRQRRNSRGRRISTGAAESCW